VEAAVPVEGRDTLGTDDDRARRLAVLLLDETAEKSDAPPSPKQPSRCKPI